MNKILRLTIPLLAAIIVLVIGLFLVEASAASMQSGSGMEAALLVTTLEDELNSDGDCSLREAIEAANTNASVDACPAGDVVITDTVTFEVAGTITLASQLVVTAGGPLVVDGEDAITISGNQVTRVWWMETGSVLILQRLVVTQALSWGAHGGGLYNNGGDLTILHSYFTHNWSGYSLGRKGGGIYSLNGTITVLDSMFMENICPGDESLGGGIAIEGGTGSIIRVLFQNNGAGSSWSYSPGGGALWISGAVVNIQNSSFISNYSNPGGGAIASYGELTITNSTISENYDNAIYAAGRLVIANSMFSNNGGFAGGAIRGVGTIAITNSTFSGNGADVGGALNLFGNTVTISNSTFTDNGSGFDGGGGIYNKGHLSITNSTFSNNIAYDDERGDGGGIYNSGVLSIANSTFSGNSAYGDGGGGGIANEGPDAILINTIVANSLAGGDCYGSITDGGYNLDSDDTCGFDPANGSVPNTDPLLEPLQDNGGPTWTHALLFGSPAIDAGDDAQCPEADQRGVARPQDGDRDGEAVCDIGSYEYEMEDGVYLHPSQQDASARRGDTLVYTFQLYNFTNFTDTFSLMLGPHAWETILSTEVIGPLGSGTSQTLTTSVTIPLDADWYLTDTVVITAASITRPAVFSDTARITSQVYAAPEISLAPQALEATLFSGDTVTQTLTISNGNGVTLTFAIAEAANWLFVEPASGEVGTSSSLPVQVFIDAAGLPGGVYISPLQVNSNDPNEPLISVPVTMTVLDVPIEGLSAADDSPTLLGEVTTLSATVTGGTNVIYTWDFGDGEEVIGQIVMHTYPVVGIYTATVMAENSAGSATAATQPVILEAPIEGLAAFNDSPTLLGEVTTLSATVSAGTNVIYTWDFGDGEEVIGQMVTHTYPAVGVYTATVTAENSAGSATAGTQPVILDVPIEGLSASNDSPTLLGEVSTLSATVSAGTNVVFTWDFGDGETGSGQVVTHTYPAVGVYTATVTAENSAGSATAATQPVILDVPIQGLTASNDSPTLLGYPATLSATVSAGTNVIFAWDFGDGETGSGQVVTHTYASVGVYTATVTATNPVSELSETTAVTIIASPYETFLPLVNKNSTPVPAPAAAFGGILLSRDRRIAV